LTGAAGKNAKTFFGEKDGWTNVVQDLKVLRDQTADKFVNVPMVLMGHSRGSFLARAYAGMFRLNFIKAVVMRCLMR